jgi:hypothetical protein
MKAFPELAAALAAILDRLDASLRSSGYAGPPIDMFLAGGLAVNFYCGTRYTEDVDASFSRRIILPKNLEVTYRAPGGKERFIYFDENYNTSFALLHDDFEIDSLPWPGIGNEQRLVHLKVLSAVDLAVSKVARFSTQDRDDIRALASEHLFDAGQFRQRALEASGNFIGNKLSLQTSIELARGDIMSIQTKPHSPQL